MSTEENQVCLESFPFLLQNVSNSFDAGPVKVKINISPFLGAHSLELASE